MGAWGQRGVQLDVYDGLGRMQQDTGVPAVHDAQEHGTVLCLGW